MAMAVWAAAACDTAYDHELDLRFATARTMRQTAPGAVRIYDGEPPRRYHVLGDILVHGAQLSVFGTPPSPELLLLELRRRAAHLGADALIQVRFGTAGMTFTSWHEHEVRGRAIRY